MKTLGDQDAKAFIPSICYAFSQRVSSEKQFIQFVTVNVQSHEVRALSFAKAGMKKEALAEARATKNRAFITIINNSV